MIRIVKTAFPTVSQCISTSRQPIIMAFLFALTFETDTFKHTT